MPFRVETVMLGPDTGQYRGTQPAAMTIDGIASLARKIEQLGFDGATTPEAGRDPFLPLAIAAEHTNRISLGTNVAIAFPRAPMVTAQLAWDLQLLSGGRFRLGLGTQVKGHNEGRYSTPWTAPPGPRLREYLLCLKAIFRAFQEGGGASSFSGAHYRFTLLPPFFNPGPIPHPHVPIYIAALNRYMARLGGELCDGLRLHPISTFRYTRERVLPAIEEGVKRAGRHLREIDIVGAPFLAIGSTPREVEAAKAALRQRVAFYASTRTYHSVLKLHGWTDVGAELHQLSRMGRWSEMPELISDEMLEEFAIIATYDELARELQRRCEGIFSTLLLDFSFDLVRNEAWVRNVVQTLRAP